MQTEEYLLDGMKILQDSDEYRFTSDSVLLARFLKAKREERVADFCSGSGVVGLHFYGENSGVEHVTLFEMQPRLARMSAKSVALNGLQEYFTVENVRLQEIPAHYTEAFSLILCNPPYERGGFSAAAENPACVRLEPKKLQFIAGKEGAKPYAVLIAAVKGGKAGLDVLPAQINGRD